MDSIGEQALELMREEKKRKKDKGRLWHGKMIKRRLHVINNPAKIAFRGWEDETKHWSLATRKDYLEWCHISMIFAPHHHQFNHCYIKGNLKYALNEDFKLQCIQVHQYLCD